VLVSTSYSTLVAPKGTSGAIANLVSYTLLDIATVLDDAQLILFQYLRCREMRQEYVFSIPVGVSFVPLPANFLDPIGTIYVPTQNHRMTRKDESWIVRNRMYNDTTGTLLTVNPLTTTLGSSLVSVNFLSHGFNQGSRFYMSGATAVNGITPNGTFPIVAITDANDFVIDCSVLGATASASGSGGGSSISYVCDNIQQGTPQHWAIWGEQMQFDWAANLFLNCSLLFFQQPLPLSLTNQTNFATNRYANLLRTACKAAAADFMKDETEYQKQVQVLQGQIMRVSQQDDLQYRGMEIQTETPGT